MKTNILKYHMFETVLHTSIEGLEFEQRSEDTEKEIRRLYEIAAEMGIEFIKDDMILSDDCNIAMLYYYPQEYIMADKKLSENTWRYHICKIHQTSDVFKTDEALMKYIKRRINA